MDALQVILLWLVCNSTSGNHGRFMSSNTLYLGKIGKLKPCLLIS